MVKKLTILLFTTLLSITTQAQDYRSINGEGNNIENPTWGANQSNLLNETPIAFTDGYQAPAGISRPNPRVISNNIFNQNTSTPNQLNISDFGWNFGQFIDHDITFVDDMADEFISVDIEPCDEFMDPYCTGNAVIPMRRSKYIPESGTELGNHRQFINEITAFVDASTVYGSDNERANWLRTFTDGKLKISEGNFLPFNTITGEKNAPVDPNAPFMLLEGIIPNRHFVAGDLRANEQPGLTCMHTLFVREHNRLCEQIKTENPTWSDEQIYQTARKWVGAYIQNILYSEFLPALGIEINSYNGYQNDVNPSIINVFSAAAYRLGHSLVNEQIIRLDENGAAFSFGSVHIKDAFFNPFVITEEGGIEPFLRGMATQRQQNFDTNIVSTLRNFLFGTTGGGGLDLVAINIQRGRERGLADYNTIRESFGLNTKNNFAHITSNKILENQLRATYNNVHDIDPWVGMLSEDKMENKAVGELVHSILKLQFEHLRDGDRFWYENDSFFNQNDKNLIKNTYLSNIIKRNTNIQNIQDNVFFAQNADEILTDVNIIPFENISSIEINAYPNPVAKFLNINIDSEKNDNATIRITDATGTNHLVHQTKLKKGNNKIILELNEKFTTGVYLLNIRTEKYKGNLKIIKK